jgi:sec-independent protein translocase protein TatA
MELAPWHWAVVIIIAIVLFGSKKLPDLGKGLGEGFRGFKEGLKGITEDTPKPADTANVVTPKPETPTEPIK